MLWQYSQQVGIHFGLLSLFNLLAMKNLHTKTQQLILDHFLCQLFDNHIAAITVLKPLFESGMCTKSLLVALCSELRQSPVSYYLVTLSNTFFQLLHLSWLQESLLATQQLQHKEQIHLAAILAQVPLLNTNHIELAQLLVKQVPNYCRPYLCKPPFCGKLLVCLENAIQFEHMVCLEELVATWCLICREKKKRIAEFGPAMIRHFLQHLTNRAEASSPFKPIVAQAFINTCVHGDLLRCKWFTAYSDLQSCVWRGSVPELIQLCESDKYQTVLTRVKAGNATSPNMNNRSSVMYQILTPLSPAAFGRFNPFT